MRSMASAFILKSAMLVSVTIFGASTQADDSLDPYIPTLAVEKISGALELVLHEKSFPAIDNGDLDLITSNDPLPEEIEKAYVEVANALGPLGQEYNLKLGWLLGIAYNELKAKTIAVDVRWVTRAFGDTAPGDRKLALQFVFAHEFSHYIIDLFVMRHSPDKKTPSGYPERPRFFDNPEPYPKTVHEILAFLPDQGSEVFGWHSEVDAMAVLIMEKMRKSPAEIKRAYTLLNKNMSAALAKEPAVYLLPQFEISFRLKTLDKNFPAP